MRHKKSGIFAVLAVALALALLLPGAALAQDIAVQAFPALYSGTVTNEAGKPAPDGAVISAKVLDWGHPEATAEVLNGAYKDLKVFPYRTYIGQAVKFYIDVDGDGPIAAVAASTATTVVFQEWVGYPGEPSGTVNLTYTRPHVLLSIAVTPETASVEEGKTQQFQATGSYYDETTENVSAKADWTSSKTTVATISAAGLATAKAAGTTTITAAIDEISGSATLTVMPVLKTISVAPATASVEEGKTQQFIVSGTMSDGSAATAASLASATWASSSTSVATVSTAGLATAKAAGTATVTATVGTISGSATLTVMPVLKTISVAPATASVEEGKTQQFTVSGTMSDGSAATAASLASATWASSSTSVATVSTAGLATAKAAGTATVTATVGTISGSATLTVMPVLKMKTISVAPATASVEEGKTQQFTVSGTMSDGSAATAASLAGTAWTSSKTTVATISAAGLATAKSAGTATITATVGTISSSATLTVMPVLASISVAPATAEVKKGETQQFTVSGTMSDGSAATAASLAGAAWTSSKTTVATISAAGLATAKAAGDTTITATIGAISGSAELTVTAPLALWWLWLIIAVVVVAVVVIVLVRRGRRPAAPPSSAKS